MCTYTKEAPGWRAEPSREGAGDYVDTITPTGHRYRTRPPDPPGTRTPSRPRSPNSIEMYNPALLDYSDAMSELTLTEARARLADVVDEARVGHDPVFLTRRGRRVAAVIDADDLERLIEAAEDLADIKAAQVARKEMAESGEGPVPWDQVKADLGLR